MTTPRHSNKFLDNLTQDTVDSLDAGTGVLERLLTDLSEGDSPNGVNPNSKAVLKQMSGQTVDQIRAFFDRVEALRQASNASLTEVRRIRVDQGYSP